MAKLIQLKDSSGNVFPQILKSNDLFITTDELVPSDWKTIDRNGVFSCSNWRTSGIPVSHSYYGILVVFTRYVSSRSYKTVIYFDAEGNVFTNMLWNNVEQGWRKITQT